MNNIQRSIDVILYINGIAVAGQQQASLSRSMSPINITNKINNDWTTNIGGTKNWSIQCNGTYVKNAESLKMLERAFMNNEEITVKIILNECNYEGQALITSFPLSAVFNTQFKYTLSLLGTGELRLIEDTGD